MINAKIKNENIKKIQSDKYKDLYYMTYLKKTGSYCFTPICQTDTPNNSNIYNKKNNTELTEKRAVTSIVPNNSIKREYNVVQNKSNSIVYINIYKEGSDDNFKEFLKKMDNLKKN